MKKVLFILGEFSDGDIDWLVAVGRQQAIATGQVLITEGKPIDALYIILEGHFAVSVAAMGNRTVAEVGCGEVIGEMSFIDERPPSATVTAQEPSRVLAVSRAAVMARLRTDIGFGARFYRALAVFLSDRLRATVSHLGFGKETALDERQEYEDELDMTVLEKITLAGARFDWMLRRLSGG